MSRNAYAVKAFTINQRSASVTSIACRIVGLGLLQVGVCLFGSNKIQVNNTFGKVSIVPGCKILIIFVLKYSI